MERGILFSTFPPTRRAAAQGQCLQVRQFLTKLRGSGSQQRARPGTLLNPLLALDTHGYSTEKRQ